VGGVPIQNFARQVGVSLTEERKSQIDDGVRHAAYRIIENKGATYYGIGAGIAQIVQAIRDDERRVLTVSSLTKGAEGFKGISLSLPRVIGAKGVATELRPDLSSEEDLALKKSAEVLKEAAVSLKMM
jgi:L-lactate dehydrogenase